MPQTAFKSCCQKQVIRTFLASGAGPDNIWMHQATTGTHVSDVANGKSKTYGERANEHRVVWSVNNQVRQEIVEGKSIHRLG